MSEPIDTETLVARLRDVSQQMFTWDDPDTNPPLIDWSGDVDDAVQAIVEAQSAIELGARAAKLVAMMLDQAGKYLTHGYGEINEVLIEARIRGWLDPIRNPDGS